MNWKNIGGNCYSIYLFVLTVYPNLDAEKIWASILDGTILIHAANLGLIWMSYQFGKEPNIHIRYVAE
ncbi:MAG: hypothetical protein RQ767_05255 [Thermovirgaceae bacterium]|nr:hypothetical protein [Thermovirgaceae bacterium]